MKLTTIIGAAIAAFGLAARGSGALASNQNVCLYTVQGQAVREINADPASALWGVIGG
jgi:hypothetical protein